MYLLTELQIIPLLVLFLLWGLAGWLMTLRWFDLEPHERGFIGFGLGLVVANWIGNFVFFRKRADIVGRIDANTNDLQVFKALLCLQFRQFRHFFYTGRTPSRPEINKQ